MQQEFDSDHPELGIQVIGVNEWGQEHGNANLSQEIPWLQDVDEDGNSQSDVWELWNVEWRDLMILDRNNVPVRTFNLTTFDLNPVTQPSNYAEVKQAFLDAATESSGEGEAKRTAVAFDQVITEWYGT